MSSLSVARVGECDDETGRDDARHDVWGDVARKAAAFVEEGTTMRRIGATSSSPNGTMASRILLLAWFAMVNVYVAAVALLRRSFSREFRSTWNTVVSRA